MPVCAQLMGFSPPNTNLLPTPMQRPYPRILTPGGRPYPRAIPPAELPPGGRPYPVTPDTKAQLMCCVFEAG